MDKKMRISVAMLTIGQNSNMVDKFPLNPKLDDMVILKGNNTSYFWNGEEWRSGMTLMEMAVELVKHG